MTSNPFIKRLLGEASQEEAPPMEPPAPSPGPERPSYYDPDQEQVPDGVQAPNAAGAALATQELAQQWQRGDHMGVATKLMFTEASYADFVHLVFLLGRDAGRELGQLLDELADSEGIEPPTAPPQYQNMLQRVVGADGSGADSEDIDTPPQYQNVLKRVAGADEEDGVI